MVNKSIRDWTDVRDKNGVEISKNDIVKVIDENCQLDIMLVGFEHGSFFLYSKNGYVRDMTLWDAWYNDYTLEIVGNLHENPELW